MFVAMCSPARNLDSAYHAVSVSSASVRARQTLRWLAVRTFIRRQPLGEVLHEADENETIIYADIGECDALPFASKPKKRP